MLNATVVKKILIAKGLAVFCVKPDEAIADFIPGQYATLGVFGSAPRPVDFPPETTVFLPDKLIKRPYSIASAPTNKEYVEFYLAILPEGDFTSRIELVKEQDRIYMAPKMKGTFTLRHVPEGTNLLMVSTGTGLAPYVSMLRTPGIWERYKKITLLHGVRYAHDFAYRDELLNLTKTNDFYYEAIVSRPDESWAGHKGYVQELLKNHVIVTDPATDHVLLCGNPGMIKDMSELLVTVGFKEHTKREPGNLHIEKYW